MTLHYHMTPITPNARLDRCAGRLFGVSFERPDQVEQVHRVAQGVMLDNGAYTAFRKGRAVVDWTAYYAWCDRWLDYATTWAVIPDEIDAGSQQQDALLREWPHGDRGSPVWHTNEPIDRLLGLAEKWPLVCIGSTDDHWDVGGDVWAARLDETFDALEGAFKRVPKLHMLRGMAQCGKRWPFYSVDSSSVGKNSHRRQAPLFEPIGMACGADEYAARFDAVQCPPRWIRPVEKEQAA